MFDPLWNFKPWISHLELLTRPKDLLKILQEKNRDNSYWGNLAPLDVQFSAIIKEEHGVVASKIWNSHGCSRSNNVSNDLQCDRSKNSDNVPESSGNNLILSQPLMKRCFSIENSPFLCNWDLENCGDSVLFERFSKFEHSVRYNLSRDFNFQMLL